MTLYQNATLDLYDADRGSGNARPHLTDLYLSTTWRPERWLSLTGSFADRRSVYFRITSYNVCYTKLLRRDVVTEAYIPPEIFTPALS